MRLKPKFIQITEYPQGFRPKMIFLVPRRLHQEFFELVASRQKITEKKPL